MGARLSGSQISQARACLYPFRPDVDVPATMVGTAARTGTLFASLRENFFHPERPVRRVPGADERRARRLFERWKAWWPTFAELYEGYAWESEVQYALHVESGSVRTIPRSEHRAYEGLRRGEIPGTADIVGTKPGARFVVVLDDKTGKRENVQPADENDQLAFLASCAARVSKSPEAIVGLVFPALLDEPDGGVDMHALTMGALAEVEQSFARLVPVDVGSVRPHVTDSCWKCALKQLGGCPVYDAVDADFGVWSPSRRFRRRDRGDAMHFQESRQLTKGAGYEKAKAWARARAEETGRDWGIEWLQAGKSPGLWNAFSLPARDFRQGHELRCEVVSCFDLSRCKPGHGPKTSSRDDARVARPAPVYALSDGTVSFDDGGGTRPIAGMAVPPPAASDRPMRRIKKDDEKLADVAKSGKDAGKVEEASRRLKEELADDPRDNEFAPGEKSRKPRPEPSAAFTKLIETTYSIDVEAEYARLDKALKLGEKRSERGYVLKAADEVEDNARAAFDLYLCAVRERAAWEAEAEVIMAPIRKSANEALQNLKAEGLFSKIITDADVRSKMAIQSPDEFRWHEDRSAKLKGIEEKLKRFSDLWYSRCATARTICDKAR